MLTLCCYKLHLIILFKQLWPTSESLALHPVSVNYDPKCISIIFSANHLYHPGLVCDL